MLDFLTFLRENPYPGRGILVGKGRVYYFIMGRSANSRNRVFVKTEDGIRTEAYDPALLTDPSLIIYHPVRRMGDALVVTNGDQTDTICQYGDFRKGLMTRKYEPDEPNWTPRISALINGDGSFELSILKHNHGRCLREFFFLHQAAKVNPIRGKIPLHLFGKSRVGCHQIECCLIRAVQLSAPPAHRGQLGYQRFIPFRMVHQKTPPVRE